jgi:hypothetical protein
MMLSFFWLSISQKTCLGGSRRLGQFPFGCLIGIFRQCTSLRMINGSTPPLTRLSAPLRMNSLPGCTHRSAHEAIKLSLCHRTARAACRLACHLLPLWAFREMRGQPTLVCNLYSAVVIICTTSLTCNTSAFCPHSVLMGFVWI